MTCREQNPQVRAGKRSALFFVPIHYRRHHVFCQVFSPHKKYFLFPNKTARSKYNRAERISTSTKPQKRMDAMTTPDLSLLLTRTAAATARPLRAIYESMRQPVYIYVLVRAAGTAPLPRMSFRIPFSASGKARRAISQPAAPAHRIAQILSSVYPYFYYITLGDLSLLFLCCVAFSLFKTSFCKNHIF